MSKFAYTARSTAWETFQGVIEADSEREAIDRLAQKGQI